MPWYIQYIHFCCPYSTFIFIFFILGWLLIVWVRCVSSFRDRQGARHTLVRRILQNSEIRRSDVNSVKNTLESSHTLTLLVRTYLLFVFFSTSTYNTNTTFNFNFNFNFQHKCATGLRTQRRVFRNVGPALQGGGEKASNSLLLIMVIRTFRVYYSTRTVEKSANFGSFSALPVILFCFRRRHTKSTCCKIGFFVSDVAIYIFFEGGGWGGAEWSVQYVAEHRNGSLKCHRSLKMRQSEDPFFLLTLFCVAASPVHRGKSPCTLNIIVVVRVSRTCRVWQRVGTFQSDEI